MVRVDPSVVLTGRKPSDTLFEVVERHGEVARVATCRLQPEASGAEHADPHEGQDLERTSGGS